MGRTLAPETLVAMVLAGFGAKTQGLQAYRRTPDSTDNPQSHFLFHLRTVPPVVLPFLVRPRQWVDDVLSTESRRPVPKRQATAIRGTKVFYGLPAEKNAEPAPVRASRREPLCGHGRGSGSYHRARLPSGIQPRRLGGVAGKHRRKRT